MEKYKDLLASVGWFIPPYVTKGFIATVSSQIKIKSTANFFKVMACIDFLCFISALKSDVSFFAPEPTQKSNKLYLFYLTCKEMQKLKPK